MNNNYTIYQSKEFSVYSDSVIQDTFLVKAISRKERNLGCCCVGSL